MAPQESQECWEGLREKQRYRAEVAVRLKITYRLPMGKRPQVCKINAQKKAPLHPT